MPVLSSKGHRCGPVRRDDAEAAPRPADRIALAGVEPGQKLVLVRNPDYWGRDLPDATRGMFNFDRVDIDYYRDANGLFEVFKAGLCDFRIESDPARWLTAYDFRGPFATAATSRSRSRMRLPKGMEGFAFNTRARQIFADVKGPRSPRVTCSISVGSIVISMGAYTVARRASSQKAHWPRPGRRRLRPRRRSWHTLSRSGPVGHSGWDVAATGK